MDKQIDGTNQRSEKGVSTTSTDDLLAWQRPTLLRLGVSAADTSQFTFAAYDTQNNYS